MENLYKSSEEYSHIKNALFVLAVDIFTKNKKNFDLSETEAYMAYSHEETFVKNLLKDVITKFKRSQPIAIAVKEDGFENTKAFANKINFRGFSADPFQDLEKNELINGIIKMAWFYVFAPSQFEVQKNMLSKKSTESEANKKKKNDYGVKKDFGKSWDFNDYIDNSNEDNDEEDFDDDEDEENDEAHKFVVITIQKAYICNGEGYWDKDDWDNLEEQNHRICYIYDAKHFNLMFADMIPDYTPKWLYEILNKAEQSTPHGYCSEDVESTFEISNETYNVLIHDPRCTYYEGYNEDDENINSDDYEEHWPPYNDEEKEFISNPGNWNLDWPLKHGGRKAPLGGGEHLKTISNEDGFYDFIFDNLHNSKTKINKKAMEDIDKIDWSAENAGIEKVGTTSSGVDYVAGWVCQDYGLPILIFMYWDGKNIRAFVPFRGNPIDTITKSMINGDFDNDEYLKKNFGIINDEWDDYDSLGEYNFNDCLEEFEARLTVIDENGNEIKTENNKSNSNIKNLLEKLLSRIIKYCDDNSIVISSTTDDNVVMEFDDDFCTTDLPSNGKNVWCIYKNGSVSIDGVVKDLSSLNENDIAKIYYMIVANISCDDDIYEKCVTGADKKLIFTLGQQFNPSHYKDNPAYNKQMLRNAAKLPKCKTESMNKVIELIYEHYGFTRMELYWEISLKQHYLTVRDIYYNPIIYIYKDTPNLIYVGNYMQNTPIDMNNPGWEKKLITELDAIRKREKQIDQERENNGFNDALRKAGLYDIFH